MVTFDFHPTLGGIQTRVKSYVRNLVNAKNQVILVHLLNPRVLQKHFGLVNPRKVQPQMFLGATVLRFPSRVKYIFQVFFAVIGAIKKTEVDVIHVISGGTTPIGLLFLFYGKMRGIRTGVSFYGKDILSSKHNLLDILIMRFSMFLSSRIGVNSRSTSKLIPKIFRNKTSILYPGVDTRALKSIRKAKEAPNNEKVILFVGRLVWRKSVHELLLAFQMVLKEISGAKLVIVGDGLQRKALEKLSRKLGVQSKVEFTGFLEGKELWERYNQCDIFVMPSKDNRGDTEGFGMVFLEAGLFKKPSIGTWCGGIPEAVLNNTTGLLIQQGDVEALKDAIKLLLTNSELAERLGRNAYNRIMAEFTWEKATGRLLNMYH
ncbi:MAG: glycosyltransferase family 4 protein [Candidatus Bathyarchaeota archaeon]|nr:MAG: glycosyltransferase family 4 protein [Candidatus Bathyarchaeota archaeon]